MKVRELMTQEVVKAGRGTKVRDLARMMADQNVGSVVIAQDGSVQGIVTDRDIVVYCLAEGMNPDECTADTIMSTGEPEGTIAEISADADILDAAKRMGERRVRRLPVLENENLVGVISAADLAGELRKDLDALLWEESKSRL